MPGTHSAAPGRRRRRPGGPVASLRRLVRYRLLIPVFRSRHAPEYTARGVAIGVFWGLTPTIGMQTVAILLTWWLCRRILRRDSSLIQALIWVWVNNPITMVPLFYVFYVTGQLATGHPPGTADYARIATLWSTREPSAPLLDRALALVATLGVRTLIGSLPWATLGAALGYRWAVAVRRRADERRRV